MKITLLLEPQPKGRPRFGRGFARTPEKTRRFERDVALLLREVFRAPKWPTQEPVKVEIILVSSRPKRPKRRYPSKYDLDNAVKAVSDAANGIVWKDDTQIVTLNAHKRFDEEHAGPAIHFSVEVIE